MKAKRRRVKDATGEMPVVASATECTGLMPALPDNGVQDAAEAALYDIHEAVDSTR
jgi:hypothetical protein